MSLLSALCRTAVDVLNECDGWICKTRKGFGPLRVVEGKPRDIKVKELRERQLYMISFPFRGGVYLTSS